MSTVDQRFSRSASSTLPQQLNTTTLSTSDDGQQHDSPFHLGPSADFLSRPTFGASHGFQSVHRPPDDQPLDLTGGGPGRKRRGDGSPNSKSADVDSPLDLSMKRPRTDASTARLSELTDQAVSGGVRGGLAMCGGGVVGHSPLRSVHVARSPVPLAQLHAAAGQQVPAEDVPRLGACAGAVPVIRRASSTHSRGLRTNVEHTRPPGGLSRIISDGNSRLSNTRHARDITVVVNGHRPDVLVGAGTKEPTTGGRSNVVRSALTLTDFTAERRGIDAAFTGRYSYVGKPYDRGGITVLGGGSHVEPFVAASPASVCSAYITPPPSVRPNSIHRGSLTSAVRHLDARSKVFPTLAPFPESSGSLMTPHPVTLVDRLDPSELRQATTFLPPNIVVSSPASDLDSRALYFSDRQLNAAESSGEQLRGGLTAPVWNSMTTDFDDSELKTSTKSDERSSAFGADKCAGETVIVDDRTLSGSGASTIVAERNFAVTQMVDFVERQRTPLGGVCSASVGSHLSGSTRRVPVANVHPIMKDVAKTATITSAPSSELVGPGRCVPPTDDDTCSHLTTSSGRSLEAPPTTVKDVTALLAAGLSRGGRVSSHHMEYVKFLSKSVDDAASVASQSPFTSSLGHPRAVRGQQTMDRRRGSPRGSLTCLSAKARRQLLPYFHHSQTNIEQRQAAQTVVGKAAAVADSDVKPATTELKGVVSAAAEHPSCASAGTSSASAGRKTTPIVYFDDDEVSEAPLTTLMPAAQSISEHWRHGPATTRKQPTFLRKTTRAGLNSYGTQRKQSGTVKRRKLQRATGAMNENVHDKTATTVDDDLTDLDDVQPSSSTQVSFLRLKPSVLLGGVCEADEPQRPAIDYRRFLVVA